MNFAKFEQRLQEQIEKKAKYVAKKYADRIAQRAQDNFDNAKDNMSGVGKNIMVYNTQVDDKSYDIKAVGSQVVFMEFGTGVFNQTYPIDYMHNLPLRYHGTYGLGRGRQRSWGFYGKPNQVAKGVDNNAGKCDFYVDPNYRGEDDETHHYYGDKSNIGSSTNNQGVIITYGINPQRCLYKAIKDTKSIDGGIYKW